MRMVYNNDKCNSKGVRNYNTSANREKCQEAIEYYKFIDAEEQYHYILQRSKTGGKFKN